MKPYYRKNGITIYNADCREVLPTLAKVDLVLTDPPYGVGLGSKQRAAKMSRHGNTGYTLINDGEESVRALLNSVLFPLIRSGQRVVVTPGTRMLFQYPEPAKVLCLFCPSGAGIGTYGSFTCWQPVLCYGPKPNKRGCYPDAFRFTEAAERNGHPCPKPLGPWSWVLNRVSIEGELILDPFMGSGTTLLAARNLNRKAIGVEIEEKYCEIAARRLDAAPVAQKLAA